MKWFFFIAVNFLLSWFSVKEFQKIALKWNLLDIPSNRSTHQTPILRGAGIVFVSLWALELILCSFFNIWDYRFILIFLPGALIVSAIGFVDDQRNLPADWRMMGYIAAAVWGVFILGGTEEFHLGHFCVRLGLLGTILGIFLLAWSINLFNFMDGADGFAASEGIFILAAGGELLWLANGKKLALCAWSLAALLAGFLYWNWPRAKVFMGDAGSVFLGFVIPMFALLGEKWFSVPAILWVMLYTIFYFDATVTLLRRMFAGHVWYRAHRLHAFQRLINEQGVSGNKFLASVWILNSIFAVITFYAFFHQQYIPYLFLLTVLLITVIYLWIEKKQPMFEVHQRHQ